MLVAPQWSTTGSMVVARGFSQVCQAAFGKGLGSRRANGSAELASAVVFDPKTATFAATGSMGFPRAVVGIGPLQNGMVLVTSGWNGGTACAAASQNCTIQRGRALRDGISAREQRLACRCAMVS